VAPVRGGLWTTPRAAGAPSAEQPAVVGRAPVGRRRRPGRVRGEPPGGAASGQDDAAELLDVPLELVPPDDEDDPADDEDDDALDVEAAGAVDVFPPDRESVR